METKRFALPALAAVLIVSAVSAIAIAGIPYFTNATAEVGLANTPGFRLSIADINGDGYPDIIVHLSTDPATGDVLNKQYVYLNVQGDIPSDPFSRKFIDFTAASGIRANRQGTGNGRQSDSAIFADVDNDGDLDLFTMVYVHRSYTLATNTNDLMLNDGQGHFTLAPNSPFHLDRIWNSAAAVFVDYDNDSKVDLFVGNWYWNDVLSHCLLYKGGGDGSFTNVTTPSNIGSAATCNYAVGAWDWNSDGYQDLFAATYSNTAVGARSIHWRNNHDGTFTQVQTTTGYGTYVGYQTGRSSFGSMPRDYDNDGDIDHLEVITHGAGDGASGVHTTTVTNNAGVFSWEFFRVTGRNVEDPDTTHHGDHYGTWFDIDNDGLVDFALTECGYSNNRFYVFKQAADHTFRAVTADTGMTPINDANLPPHNVLAFDYDLDGDDDLVVGFADNTDGIQVWRNDEGTNNNWIVIDLEGGGAPGFANRSAVGARVEADAAGITQTREVYAGCGHQGPQVPLGLHFGVAKAAIVDSLTVHWPNQAQTSKSFTNICVNRFLKIREICTAAQEPVLRAVKKGNDVEFTWDEPSTAAWWWNLYRDANPNPALWGQPHETCLSDQDNLAPGIQVLDAGALPGPPSLLFYRATAVNDCGEIPLD